MTHRIASIFAALVFTSAAQAQWVNQTYSLADGWNSLWLSGDASYATVDTLLQNYPQVTQVWRWNPNPDQVTFTASPSEPTMQSDEWTIWQRGDVDEQRLSRLIANSAYLVFSEGASQLTLKLKPVPPAASWQISGANFLGFPAQSKTPTFSQYFASFPSANSTVLSPSAKIYKYVGGPLSATNPRPVSPSADTIDPNAAYWFDADTVSNFTAPLEYESPSAQGLAFGRTLSTLNVGVTNRSTTSLTVTVSLEDSATAPAGQPGVNGGVSLIRRQYNEETETYSETPLVGSFAVTIPASGRTNLEFAVDRSQLTDSSAFRASILRLQDSSRLTDVRLPVSAQATTPAGLWIAKTLVDGVVSNTPNARGTEVSRPFELRFLVHVDGAGAARLLSQVFTGRLAAPGNPLGIAISEEAILGHSESNIPPARYFAPQMPLVPYLTGNGQISNGSSVTWQIPIPYDAATNPFVHTYHPDHDNLDASFSLPLPEGAESYDIGRDCSFTFTSTPPRGDSIPGWGTTILGGNYSEVLTGLSATPISVTGTFVMHRLSEISQIDLTLPSN